MLRNTPMSAAPVIRDFFSLLAPAVEAVIVAVMWRKKLFAEFPAFSTYAIFHAFKIPIGFYLQHLHPTHKVAVAYFLFYVIAEAIAAVLAYACIYELYRKLFCNHGKLQQITRVWPHYLAGALLLFGVVTAAINTGNAPGLLQEAFAARQAIDIMRFGLVITLLSCASILRIRWPSYAFGIAIGFAFYGSCELLGQELQLHTGGNVGSMAYSVLMSAALASTATIWLTYFLKAAPATEHVAELPIDDLSSWNDALAGMLNSR